MKPVRYPRNRATNPTSFRTPYTPLYGDVLDYLERSGLPSVGGIFDDYDESKNPFIIDFEESTSSDDLEKTDSPLVQATRGGGGDFSVYNPDPTRTRTSDEYSPYAYRQAAERDLIGDFYSSGTEAQKLMDMYPEYYTGPQLTGIPGLAADFFKNSLVGKGIASLEDILPVNRRAILENEALGAGIALDDIGRIVQGSGDYDSAENVMAGYNLAQITPETIQKRRETIQKTMSKPGYSGNLQERLDALDDFERQKFGTTGVKSRADMITEQRLIEEDPTYQSFDDLVAAGLLAGDDDDDDYEFNPLDIMTKQNKYYNPYEVGLITAQEQRARLEQIQRQKEAEAEKARQEEIIRKQMEAQNISRNEAQEQNEAIREDQERDSNRGGVGEGEGGVGATGPGSGGGYNQGNFCFDPNTFIQMADGSEKKIKEIQLGDQTKGGEVTGVFQFKASDEIHDYKGVTVAGSHYVKENGKFIMVKDSPLSTKIDRIPVVYSLDTTGRRIFINNIEFADYNGDGVAKNFLTNAGVDLTGFDKEVLRQVENRLI
jgi:hypothetical protein